MSDKEALFCLCFGDTEQTATEFFSIKEVATITEYSEGRLSAMASLIPLCMEDKKVGFYVYGVCVHPDFRGLGGFRRIMQGCEDYAKEKGADFLCLIPATPLLASSYGRMGYSKRVQLYDGADSDAQRIYLLSEDFARFAIPAGDSDTEIDFGLLKPLADIPDKKHAFASPMGDR